MNVSALLIIIKFLSSAIGVAGSAALLARVFKKWQVHDIAHTLWASLLLVDLAVFCGVVALGYWPSRLVWTVPFAAIFAGLSLFRSASRIRRRRRGDVIRRDKRLDGLIVAIYFLMIGAGYAALRPFLVPPPAPNPPLATLPAWTPPAAKVARLTPEVPLDGYGVRPPAGFVRGQWPITTQDSFGTRYKWGNTLRNDQTRTVFEVEILHPRPGYHPMDSLTTLLGQEAAIISASHTGVTTSPVQIGNLRGAEFGRLYWHGFWPRTGKINHGLVYISSSPDTLIRVYASDAEPYQTTTLPLCEAAALTIRKL